MTRFDLHFNRTTLAAMLKIIKRSGNKEGSPIEGSLASVTAAEVVRRARSLDIFGRQPIC